MTLNASFIYLKAIDRVSLGLGERAIMSFAVNLFICPAKFTDVNIRTAADMTSRNFNMGRNRIPSLLTLPLLLDHS